MRGGVGEPGCIPAIRGDGGIADLGAEVDVASEGGDLVGPREEDGAVVLVEDVDGERRGGSREVVVDAASPAPAGADAAAARRGLGGGPTIIGPETYAKPRRPSGRHRHPSDATAAIHPERCSRPARMSSVPGH